MSLSAVSLAAMTWSAVVVPFQVAQAQAPVFHLGELADQAAKPAAQAAQPAAQAAQPAAQATQPAAAPDPLVAAALSMGTAGSAGLAIRSFAGGTYSPYFTMAAPLALGLGHAYAGDPLRGLGIGLGGVAAVPAVYFASAPLVSVLTNDKVTGESTGGFLAFGAAVLYGLWASFDAYDVAESKAASAEAALAGEAREAALPGEPRNPWIAAGLSVVVPVAVGSVGLLGPEFAGFAPVGFVAVGAGHFYAGDPVRGALIGLGEVAVPLGVYALVTAGSRAAGLPEGGFLSVPAALGLLAGSLSFVGYTVFAIADAYGTTIALNERREPGPSR